jgi:hypothetical protein
MTFSLCFEKNIDISQKREKGAILNELRVLPQSVCAQYFITPFLRIKTPIHK